MNRLSTRIPHKGVARLRRTVEIDGDDLEEVKLSGLKVGDIEFSLKTVLTVTVYFNVLTSCC